MNFRVWVPLRRDIPDAVLIGLAERTNKRLGKPLQEAVDAEDLLEQTELERLVPPLPADAFLDVFHQVSYSRQQLQKLAHRKRVTR